MTIEYKDSKRIITSPSSATSVQGYSQLNAGTNGWNIASGALDGERLSLQIVSGSSIIADPIKEIKMKLSKNSSPTDTFYEIIFLDEYLRGTRPYYDINV